MKITLISPPSRIMSHYRPPLALMYLSGYLKKKGLEARIIDITFKNQVRGRNFYQCKDGYLLEVEEEIIRRLRSDDTDIVGLTCYTPEFLEVERLAKRIKSVKPKTRIVVGGTHPTFYPEDFLNASSPFDFAVMGEGEITFFELVKAIRSWDDSYKRVKGISYFDQMTSRVIITERPLLVDNIDEISFPDYEDLDMDFYTTPSPYAIRGVLTKSFYILSSRGCPSSCTFCVSKKLREHYRGQNFVRLRSPGSLWAEIQELKNKYSIDSFYFIDDLFTLKKNNVYEFCDLLIKNKSHLIWGCSSKVNTVDYEMLRKMKDAGCMQIDFGVERGSDEALEYLKKGITVDKIKKTFRYCHQLGMRTFANMLINTPQETEEDLGDIIDLVKEIKPEIVSFNVFAPYPGCEIFDSFCANIDKDDYPLLMNTSLYLSTMPDKFRFAAHSLDILDWVKKASRKYNPVLPNIYVYFKPVYLDNILHSHRKSEYLRQAFSLFNEFINQKF